MKRIALLMTLTAFLTGATWHDSMREMSAKLTELLPNLITPEVFMRAEEKAETLKQARALLKMAHDVKELKTAPSSDPQMQAVLTGLRAQIESSIKSMESGRWAHGSRELLSVSRHCIACHSMKLGPERTEFKPDFSNLSAIQQADYYAATRQFDRAVVQYEKALANPAWAKNNEERWNEAFIRLLAITVRTRNNPSLTLELISRFFDAKTYPQNLKTVAMGWRQQAKEWRKEGSKLPVTLEALRSLVARAERAQGTSREPVALIYYLRASAVAHAYLSAPEHAADAEALYLAGLAAIGLSAANIWELPETYFKSCVSLKTQSKWTDACSERLRAADSKG
ncbi:MAG TPA: hypothetical protein VFV50_14285 [Bdellovibrionales bacterium]|nr:hypothetical protein [Bdellovibrionales bacterium]